MVNLGKIAYDRYREKAGGRSLVSDDPLPFWDDLGQPVRDAWDAAALAVAEFVGAPSYWTRDHLREAEGESTILGETRLGEGRLT